MQQAKHLIKRLYDECLNRGDFEHAAEIFHPDFVAQPNGERSAEELEKTFANMRAAFANLHFDLDQVITEGDRAAVAWTMTGVHQGTFGGIAATGRSITHRAIVMYRIQDGLIVESFLSTDRLRLLDQLREPAQ